MAGSDEFAEFDTDEAAFDAMLEHAEPVELVPPPAHVTVLSAAQDAVRFREGLPVSIDNPDITGATQAIHRGPVRRPRAICHHHSMERVAG